MIGKSSPISRVYNLYFVLLLLTRYIAVGMSQRIQDLPVVLHNEKRGLLTVEEGRLDVLQLSKEGRRASTSKIS